MNQILKAVTTSLMCVLLLMLINRQVASTELSFTVLSSNIGGSGGRSNNATFDVVGTTSQTIADLSDNDEFNVQGGTWNEAYELPPQKTLSVIKSGTGSGNVISRPGGINCEPFCSFNFNFNSKVTLTPVTSLGSTFDGWSGGGCIGMGTCIVKIDSVKELTANFSAGTSNQLIFLPLISN